MKMMIKKLFFHLEIDEVIEKDPGYFSWIMKSDFPNYTKKVLNQLRLNKLNNKLQ